MAKYTLEINQIIKGNGEIFPYFYSFYDETLRKEFEEKFISHYYFHEIGFETIERFRFRLATKLNEIAPYYNELYKTILESNGLNFLFNKDLKETFIRDIEGIQENKTDTTSNDNSNNNYKDSNLENGVSNVNLSSGNLTSVSNNTVTNTSNGNLKSDNKNNLTEKTELISQGNIGTTSTAQLLQSWRECITNIDLMIIEECSDLFMQVY